MATHSNIGRLLTIKIRIVDDVESRAIWDALKSNAKLLVGCKVLAIAEGDVMHERDELQAQVDCFHDGKR